jgi:molybdenum cofactor biosynthesis enzyme MoaA
MSDAPLLHCPLPWGAITRLPFGITLCCYSWADLREREDETVLEVFRGKKMEAVRRHVLAGEWPPECLECKRREEDGQISKRQAAFKREEFKDLTPASRPLTSVPVAIRRLEVSFGNACNQACRMCSPRHSSLWEAEIPRLPDSLRSMHSVLFEKFAPVLEELKPERLAAELGSLQVLAITGGEPMLSPELVPFLSKLVESGVARNVALLFATNGTRAPDEVLRLMLRFRCVDVAVSADAPDPLFGYIRHGRFTLADIKENLDRYRHFRIPVYLSTTFQIYNMLSIVPLIEELLPWTRKLSVVAVTRLGMVASRVPDPLRLEALKRLEAYRRMAPSPAIAEKLEYLIQVLRAGRFDRGNWEAFKLLTSELDRVRNESLAQVAPELASYVEAGSS